MSLTHKSQSALEYMMTYGWAILVIVIVAAVLYSLGIFSPSSSLSTTITGFSNLGTVNAVCLGGTSFTISMGDSTGYPINVTEINLTSSSGKTTYSPNILIQPNSIQTVTVPSSSLCTSGARYSVSAVISYLEPGQIFPGPYTSTGTVAGTANSFPSSATLYEPLNITNTQSQGTSSPFQQMINVTSTSPGWGDISSSPFGQNVEFFSSTGQILDSWLENYTSTHAIWWVKLTSSISAGSKQTIYMGFAPTSTNLFNNVNDGEAPQFSPTYGEYFNAQNVFQDAWLFDTNTLPSGWTASGPYVLNSSGLWLFPNAFVFYDIPSSLQGTLILYEADWLNATSPVGGAQSFYKGFGDSIGAPLAVQLTWSPKMQPDTEFAYEYNGSSGSQVYDPYILRNQTEIVTISYLNDKTYLTVNNANLVMTASLANAPSATSIYFNQQSETNTNGQIIYALYSPSTPPNAIMPSVSFGSVS